MHDETAHTVGSGNVFVDVGLPDPETELAKAVLCARITDAGRSRGITPRAAPRVLGVEPAIFAAVSRGATEDLPMTVLADLVQRAEALAGRSHRPDGPRRDGGGSGHTPPRIGAEADD